LCRAVALTLDKEAGQVAFLGEPGFMDQAVLVLVSRGELKIGTSLALLDGFLDI